jgi:hypothetical protein
MEYLDIYEIKRLNSQKGQHFFDAGALRFFNSRISNDAVKIGNKAYFVTSEQFRPFNGPAHKRMYSVRVIDLQTGNIDTVGEFQQYASSQSAWKIIKILAKNNVAPCR